MITLEKLMTELKAESLNEIIAGGGGGRSRSHKSRSRKSRSHKSRSRKNRSRKSRSSSCCC